MKKSQQIILVITSSVALAACHRAAPPLKTSHNASEFASPTPSPSPNSRTSGTGWYGGGGGSSSTTSNTSSDSTGTTSRGGFGSHAASGGE